MRPSWPGAVWAIARNELRLWLLGPSGWAFAAGFLFLAGLFFTLAIGESCEASMRGALPNLAVTLVFTLPLLTMRQLAEEARSGTLELLLTAPVPLPALIVGKWLASVAFCAAILLATAPFPIVLFVFGDPDPGALFTSYAGLWACCAAFSAVGLLASASTRDPVVAGVVTVVALLSSWLAGSGSEMVPAFLAPWLERASFVEHLRSFARGALDLGDVAWFVAVTATALFLAAQAVESRRWR